MLIGFLRASWPAILVGTLGLQPAHADIYTWVDASGTINVSNLAPPDGVNVTKVIHEAPPAAVPADNSSLEAARQAQAQVQALAMRVGELQDEVEFARRQAALPAPYPIMPAPPLVQYVADMAPQPMQYAVDPTPPAAAGCYSTWSSCGPWWGPSFYPVSVIVLRPPHDGRFRPPFQGGHHFAMQQPGHGFSIAPELKREYRAGASG